MVTLATEGLQVKLGLSRQEMQQVKVGDEVAVEADGRVFPGTIQVIHPFPDPLTRTYEMTVALNDAPSPPPSTFATAPDTGLVPGQVVTVVIPGEVLDGIWVPVQYVLNDGDPFIYVVEKGLASRQPAYFEVFQEDQVLITGVAPGTLMITEGARLVRQGDPVIWEASTRN